MPATIFSPLVVCCPERADFKDVTSPNPSLRVNTELCSIMTADLRNATDKAKFDIVVRVAYPVSVTFAWKSELARSIQQG